MSCLSEERLLELALGNIPPNQRESLDGHVAGCAICRDALVAIELLAIDLSTLPELDVDAHTKSVMARIGESETRRSNFESRKPRARWTTYGAVASALALAAGATLVVGRSPLSTRVADSEFAARGGPTSKSLAHDVGVHIFTGRNTLEPLASGAKVAPDTSFTAVSTNIHPTDAFFLLFAVDSAGTVHWLYPAYVDARDDPASVSVPRTTRERPLPASVILDRPAPGPVRLVTIVSEEALHVSDVENRTAEALTVDALGRAFPKSAVVELRVHVDPEAR